MSVRVLVVDDETDVEMLFRQQFRRELREGKFIMEFAQSAAEALTKVRDAEGATIILLVSDINMPGMSGLELLPRIKAEWPEIPVLMVTAYGDEITRKVALERGADGFLTKPIDLARYDQRSRRALPLSERLDSLTEPLPEYEFEPANYFV
jgi:CheY-like chemotaxis protein